MENQLPVTTQLLGGQHGGGEAGAVLLASRAPLSILRYLGLVLCVVLDLMKEGCAHRGIYSVCRDRGLRTEGDCEGPSLRCLPGWCLRLGEMIKNGARFGWLPRALPRPEDQGWNAGGHGSGTLGYRKPLPGQRGHMLLSPHALPWSAWSFRVLGR